MSWEPPPPKFSNGAPPRPPNAQGWGQPPAGPPASPWGPPGQLPPGPGGPTSHLKPHRGTPILLMSIISFMMAFVGCMFCYFPFPSLILSIPAMVMARRDLAEMSTGVMDPLGKEMTVVGLIAAVASSVLCMVAGLIVGLLVLVYGTVIFAAILGSV